MERENTNGLGRIFSFVVCQTSVTFVVLAVLTTLVIRYSNPAILEYQDEQEKENREILSLSLSTFLTLRKIDQVVVVDVRSRFRYDSGHIKNAVSIPFDQTDNDSIANFISSVKEVGEKTLVLYCESINCGSAFFAAKKLSSIHLPIYVYEGGWEEWNRLSLNRVE